MYGQWPFCSVNKILVFGHPAQQPNPSLTILLSKQNSSIWPSFLAIKILAFGNPALQIKFNYLTILLSKQSFFLAIQEYSFVCLCLSFSFSVSLFLSRSLCLPLSVSVSLSPSLYLCPCLFLSLSPSVPVSLCPRLYLSLSLSVLVSLCPYLNNLKLHLINIFLSSIINIWLSWVQEFDFNELENSTEYDGGFTKAGACIYAIRMYGVLGLMQKLKFVRPIVRTRKVFPYNVHLCSGDVQL